MKEVFVLMQEQLTISRRKGHHLTEIERGIIAALHAAGASNRAIAKSIGVCPQTINNELRRGQTRQVKRVNGKLRPFSKYLPDAAHTRYLMNRLRCHRSSKFDQCQAFLNYFVEHFKTDDWSPDEAVGRAKHDCKFLAEEMVSTSTLYHYIDAQLLEIRNIDLTEKTQRRIAHHYIPKNKKRLGPGIEERSQAANDRSEFGHFEIDTIVGKRNGHESVVLNLIERQTRTAILRLIDGRDADSVAYAMQDIKRQYGHLIRSITADNGPEFSTLAAVMTDTAPVYFAHPYTSCERGTNEVHNRMIRRDLPKGLSLDTVSPARIATIQAKLNGSPRRLLDYDTPAERFAIAAGSAQRLA
ncbi:IS30 family transposase [Levilactobacillus brevis]|nr:IS30 family transposase [Levilactobacillus brevis]